MTIQLITSSISETIIHTHTHAHSGLTHIQTLFTLSLKCYLLWFLFRISLPNKFNPLKTFPIGKDSLNQNYISYRLGASRLVRSARLLVCSFVLILVIVFATPFWALSFFLPFSISFLLSWDVMGKCRTLTPFFFTRFQCTHCLQQYFQVKPPQTSKKKTIPLKSLKA